MSSTEQLRLLSIFHYVVGGLHALFSCLGLFYMGIGLMIVTAPQHWNSGPEPMPAFFPWIFVVFGGAIVLVGWTLAFLTILSGRFIARRVHRTFSVVLGAINCALPPFGTTLGVFTVVLLSRDDTRNDYAERGGVPA